jgi:hypothetical protein
MREALDAPALRRSASDGFRRTAFKGIAGRSGETCRPPASAGTSAATPAGATGITSHLVHGGTLERAAAFAGHASTRTTQPYDRRREVVESDEIERVKY